MSLLSTFSQFEFSNQREQWETLLKGELKIPEVGNKAWKKSLNEGSWPTLSLEALQIGPLPVSETWKKAAQSYIKIDDKDITGQLNSDLEAGVRNFYFEKDFLASKSWQLITDCLSKFDRPEEIEVFLLGNKEFSLASFPFKVIDENTIAIGRTAHDFGGNNVQELGLMAFCLTCKLAQLGEKVHLGVFLDTHFFRNIAKVRAAKLLALKILQEAQIQKEVRVIGLTSLREWTLFERYSNMLRNDASVAAGYISGADHVQSSGYQNLFELEGLPIDREHDERSKRMARNTSHILALESMLGVVEDAAFGSFHLEELTQFYAQSAWSFMQEILPNSPVQDYVKEKAKIIREERLKNIRTRKHVLAGMNDFPDKNENLKLTSSPAPRFFRVSQEFEGLRLQMEQIKHKPKVYVALYGDYAAMNARVNFVRNYFELLGLEVSDPHQSQNDISKFVQDLSQREEEIIVLCASDTDYSLLQPQLPKLKQTDKFIAGKAEVSGYTNLFAGQDIYEVLQSVAKKWGAK